MTSHKQKAKAEAEKIVQEFIPIIDPDFGKLIKKTTLSKAKQCAIIHVKGIMKEIPMYTGNLNPKWEFYESILTELENK